MSKKMLVVTAAIVAIVLSGCASTVYESRNRSGSESSSGHAH